jgi:hypothetical protein
MEEEEDDTSTAASATPQPVTERDSGGEKPRKGLPPYPWPPSGPNSRKAMPRDEILARRRARNRVAGMSSLYILVKRTDWVNDSGGVEEEEEGVYGLSRGEIEGEGGRV